jgi:hypothetical protein
MDVIMVATPIPSTAVEAQVGSSQRSGGGKANHEIETSHLVNTRDLAIEDGALDGEVLRDLSGRLARRVEDVSISEDEFGLAGRDVGECPKVIDL